MLLQTVSCEKAQEIDAALSAEYCADYDLVKPVILKSYENCNQKAVSNESYDKAVSNESYDKAVSTESYKNCNQKFRGHNNTNNQKHMEFANQCN